MCFGLQSRHFQRIPMRIAQAEANVAKPLPLAAAEFRARYFPLKQRQTAGAGHLHRAESPLGDPGI